MKEKSCQSMRHFEHMCSLTLNGCWAERRFTDDPEIDRCDNKSHRHYDICTPNFIGA